MDALVESFCKMKIHSNEIPTSDVLPVPSITKRQLAGAVQYLYMENVKLKNEIERLKSEIPILKPNIPNWVK